MRSCLLVAIWSVASTCGAGPPADQSAASGLEDQSVKVVEAAQALLAVLDDAQREAVLFAFNDDDQRLRWSNLPVGIFERKGLRTGDLNPEQLQAVMAVIRATLSDEGYQQVVENVEADEVLKGESAGGRVRFGKEEYFFSILGTPSMTKPWMWQFGGHHLAINATIIRDRITLAPSLTGGQPMSYTKDRRVVQQMDNEIHVAFELVNSLSADQKQKAIVAAQYGDMLLGPGKDEVRPEPQGIRADELNEAQQTLLKKLLSWRIGLLNEEDAALQQATADRELAETWFSWRGPTTPGSAASYCVQGPTVFMEFSPQQLGGAPASHIHAMYREFGNDYGLKWFGEVQ